MPIMHAQQISFPNAEWIFLGNWKFIITWNMAEDNNSDNSIRNIFNCSLIQIVKLDVLVILAPQNVAYSMNEHRLKLPIIPLNDTRPKCILLLSHSVLSNALATLLSQSVMDFNESTPFTCAFNSIGNDITPLQIARNFAVSSYQRVIWANWCVFYDSFTYCDNTPVGFLIIINTIDLMNEHSLQLLFSPMNNTVDAGSL